MPESPLRRSGRAPEPRPRRWPRWPARRESEPETPDDAALLRAVARGNPDALAALYDRHAGWLHARLTRRCGDPETVCEVLQDTFVTVWRSAGTHRGGEVGGWLWVITTRRLADAGRARARQCPGAPAQADPARSISEQSTPSAEERVLSGLEYGDVGAALDSIPAELRAVLRATVIDGLTTRETAQLLGIPEGTVKTRALRARRELRAALARLAPDTQTLGGIA
ncbi:RNA polymerase sigma factor [Streptomyces sp. NPDC005963]|uniref:RNA polymerase sigma factor n=1 Tax=Streptomyces sp. NPDC005963 TaxID=3156721 RepID=UPI00340D204F